MIHDKFNILRHHWSKYHNKYDGVQILFVVAINNTSKIYLLKDEALNGKIMFHILGLIS